MTDVTMQPAHQLAEQIRNGDLSSSELLEQYWQRFQTVNPAINAIVTTDIDNARVQAAALDKMATQKHFKGPLHGLPVTVKDTFCTAQMRTTAGSSDLSDNIPSGNATAVQRLIDAGAIVFGKSNTPKFAADLQTNNAVFGVTNNPWDVSRTPGGSSGGSAAATAAGLTAFELGSDIGGSLRSPAHFCGIYTIKPSYGIIPATGLISSLTDHIAPRDISCVGSMARSAKDLEILLDILVGPEPLQASGWQLKLPAASKALEEYRIGAWLDDDFCQIDTSVKHALNNAVNKIEAMGVNVDRNARPGFSLEHATDVYIRLLAGASAVGMSDEAYQERQNNIENYAEELRHRWAFRSVEYSLLSARDLLLAHEARVKLQQQWQQFFQQYDILLCPVNPVTAFPHINTRTNFFQDITINGKKREYAEMLVWVGALAGVSYLPAVSAPVGLSADGLPVGIQIIAPYLQDKAAIHFAELMSLATGGFVPPPDN